MTGSLRPSDEQRAAALAKAAAARTARAEVQEALGSGSLTLVQVLERSDDAAIGGIKIKTILTSLPGLGKVKSYRLLDRLGIAENRRVAALEPEQQEALLAALS
jgi:hypothetical protein